MTFLRLRCVLSFSAMLGAATSALADPNGLWRAEDGGTIRIARCGQALCATIVTVVPAIDPDTGRPPTDKFNPDPAKSRRPLIGVQVLFGLQPDGSGKWKGQLYNADDGKTYEGHLIEQSPTGIRIEGCALGVCGGEDLTRVR
jgi:uncharacterized protein (DUF2147 family)